MENINWNYPTTIWFGVDRIKEIQKACEELNIQKPLIVTDNGILKTNIINKLNDCLDKQAIVYSDVKSNPTGKNVEDGVKAFNENKHDGVIAVGGGAGRDTGKAIASWPSKKDQSGILKILVTGGLELMQIQFFL